MARVILMAPTVQVNKLYSVGCLSDGELMHLLEKLFEVSKWTQQNLFTLLYCTSYCTVGLLVSVAIHNYLCVKKSVHFCKFFSKIVYFL
jgi:hypothetical protein